MKLNFLFFLIAISVCCFHCKVNDNSWKIVESDGLDLSMLKDANDSILFQRLVDIKGVMKNSNFPIDLDFYYNIQEDSLLDFKVSKEDVYYKVFKAKAFRTYKDSERFITYSSNGLLGYWFCFYKNDIREEFCMRKNGSKYQMFGYKNDLPDGKFFEIDLKDSTTTNGFYKRVANTSANDEITVDTFISFDRATYEEKIWIRRIDGRSLKDSIWRIEGNDRSEIIHYELGKEISKE